VYRKKSVKTNFNLVPPARFQNPYKSNRISETAGGGRNYFQSATINKLSLSNLDKQMQLAESIKADRILISADSSRMQSPGKI
jgi:hypothetical protein